MKIYNTAYNYNGRKFSEYLVNSNVEYEFVK